MHAFNTNSHNRYMHSSTYTHTYIYIYIYTRIPSGRARTIQHRRESLSITNSHNRYMHSSTYTYTYTYIYIYIYTRIPSGRARTIQHRRQSHLTASTTSQTPNRKIFPTANGRWPLVKRPTPSSGSRKRHISGTNGCKRSGKVSYSVGQCWTSKSSSGFNG